MQNLISNFASQKARKKVLIEKIYEFIIKYNKMLRLKPSHRAHKFVELALMTTFFFEKLDQRPGKFIPKIKLNEHHATLKGQHQLASHSTKPESQQLT